MKFKKIATTLSICLLMVVSLVTFAACGAKPVTLSYGTIAQDPGLTGGNSIATVSNDGKTVTFSGEIAYYDANADLGREAAAYIGVQITPDVSVEDFAGHKLCIGETSTVKFAQETPEFLTTMSEADKLAHFFWVYPSVTAEEAAAGKTITIEVQWNKNAVKQTYTIVIAAGSTVKNTAV